MTVKVSLNAIIHYQISITCHQTSVTSHRCGISGAIIIHISELIAYQPDFYLRVSSIPFHRGRVQNMGWYLYCHISKRANVERGTEIRNRNRKLTFSISHSRISVITESLNTDTGNRKIGGIVNYNACKLYHSIPVSLQSTLWSFESPHLLFVRGVIIHILSVYISTEGRGYGAEKEP